MYNNQESYKAVKSNSKNEINLELEPWAWVRVHIINEQPPIDTVDYISFNSFYHTIPSLTGYCKDTIMIGKERGNYTNDIYVFWKYNQIDSIQRMRIDKLWCPGLDTVDYYFKY